jgi:maltose/moltooligosaccharide transporter
VGRIIDIAFLILNGVAAVLPAFLLEPLCRRFGQVKVHMICIGIMALGYAGLWMAANSQLSVYVLMGIIGIGWAATVSLAFAIMSQKVEQRKMGLYMGLFNLSVVLPQLVASLGVGEFLGGVADKRLTFLLE